MRVRPNPVPVLAVLAALALAACGDSGGADVDADAGPSDASAPDSTELDVTGPDVTAGDVGGPEVTPDAAGSDVAAPDGPDSVAADASAATDAAQSDSGSASVDAGDDAFDPDVATPDPDAGAAGSDAGDPAAGDAGDAPDEADPDILGPHCGDGTLDDGEECDDGSANSDTAVDACRTDCLVAYCGDGVADSGETCDDGDPDNSDSCTTSCAAGPDIPKPEPGQVIFTELMINPLTVSDPGGEWFEMHNLTSDELSLVGCVVRDEGTDIIELSAFADIVTIQPSETVLFAHVAGPDPEDGGLDADFEYLPMLLDNLVDELVLECETGVIDVVAYDEVGFPIDNGVAMALDASAFDAAANDDPASWCEAIDVYGPGAAEGVGDLGTPGVTNLACPPPDVIVDACSLLPPLSYQVLDTESVTVTLIYLEDDLTNESTGVDNAPLLIVEIGFGPDETLPSEGTWVWSQTSPASGWFNPGGLDSWVGTVTIDGVGVFDIAGRISLDGGATWNYCDGGTDPGDGYLHEDAIAVTALEHPCSSVSCDETPEPGCGLDGVTWQAPTDPDGVCLLVEDETPVCEYNVESTDCGLLGHVCSPSGCQGSAPVVTEAGSVFVSEIMLLPQLSVIPTGQWLELHNSSDGPLELQGCEIASGAAVVVIDTPLVIGPGATRVLGSSAILAANGGADVQFEWGNAIEWSAASGAVTLRCGGVDIDTVAWTAADWPIEAGESLSLSPFSMSAGDNDYPTAWCGAPEAFGAGDSGSPGAANPGCPGDVNPIEYCLMATSGFLEWPAGEPVPTMAWIVDEGLTDLTSGVDLADGFTVEVGYGPPGSDPAESEGWVFAPASPAVGWDSGAVGAPDGSDGWVGAQPAPAPGLYIVAFRVSGDGGNTWTFCDLDPGMTAFEPDQAMQLQSVEGPCWPPTCDAAPVVACEVNVVVERVGDPFCVTAGGEPQCVWPALETLEDCGAAGGYCESGACTGFPGSPAPHDVVFSELMIVPPSGETAEWIELTHADPTSLTVYDLSGCTLESADGEVLLIDSDTPDEGATTLIFPTEHYVLARSLAGGPDLQYGDVITLGNTADYVRLSCGGEVIDEVAWDATDGWSIPVAASMQLGGNQSDSAGNDMPGAWCAGPAEGTPGEANPLCPPADGAIDGCILLSPDGLDVAPGESFTALGRVFDVGVTDVTAATDAAPGIVVSFGTGPAGSAPTGPGWAWAPGFPDLFWDDVEAPGEDLWRAPVLLDATGEYDVAMRVSADGGGTWRLCDLDGSGDYYGGGGYELEQAGSVAVGAPTCVPNPCTAQPSPACEGSVLVYAAASAGVCFIGESAQPVCEFEMSSFDCSHFGGCVDGACAQLPAAPTAAGQVVITEVMRDSSLAPPDHGEWIELHNPGAAALDLRDCTLFDLAGDLFTVIGPVPVVIPANDYFVLGVTSDPLVNGGTPVDMTWDGFTLDNVFDEIAISCGGTVIDDIVIGVGWPGAQGVSMQLGSATSDATSNDDPAAWCDGATPYGSNADLGTPGQPNGDCP